MDSLFRKFSAPILLLLFVLTASVAKGQVHYKLLSRVPQQPLENVEVQKISEDSLSTTFVIWIKKEVPLHYHASHDEQIYILEGEGLMQLGQEQLQLKPGDYVAIPKKTPHGVRVSSATPLKVLSIQSPRFDGTDRVLLNKKP